MGVLVLGATRGGCLRIGEDALDAPCAIDIGGLRAPAGAQAPSPRP